MGQGTAGMADMRISRRALMASSGAAFAWRASPVRAMVAASAAAQPDLPPAVDALFRRMTLEEKAGQLTIMAAAWAGGAAATLNPASAGGGFDAQLAQARAGRLTGVFNGSGSEMAQRMQTAAIKEARLPIPLLFAADVIHGYRTVFPLPLGEAASFDPAVAERSTRVAATEAAAAGIDWTFAPNVDISRDARWGRGLEGAGEDVLLSRLMAAARVRGFQGASLAADDAVAACLKHFAAYGAAEAGLDYNMADVSERTLRQVYLPPFKAGIDAGAPTIMTAFDEVSGVPSTANDWLLTTVLRKEWSFGGVVVSDYTSDEEMIDAGYARDGRDAARLAVLAGCDISMQSGLYMKHLPDLVAAGEVPMARVDQAVRRVLALKVRLGLFDDPFRRIHPERERARVRTPAHLQVARDAARRSVVMLRNEGGLLPLPVSGERIALIGPFAEGRHDLIGPWNVYGVDADAVDLASGVRAAVTDPSRITVTPGSGIDAPLPGGIAAAVDAARAADVVVLAIGESQDMSGEAQSRTEIVVPAAQQALAEAVAATGKPYIVLLKNGRALALEGAVANAPALLVTWFLGSETGSALADLLFGRAAPSARLPVSFPRKSGQEPFYYARRTTGRPNGPGPLQPYKAHYRGVPNTALFPFGHGLTYGLITYAGLDLGDARLAWDGEITLRASIANAGLHAAEEVVQLYVRDLAASVTQPMRLLKAFRRVALAPGALREVSFTLRRADLEFVGLDLRPTVEPGDFRVWIAPSAEAQGVSGVFSLVR